VGVREVQTVAGRCRRRSSACEQPRRTAMVSRSRVRARGKRPALFIGGEGFNAMRGMSRGTRPRVAHVEKQSAGGTARRARARYAWRAKEGWRGGLTHRYLCGLGSARPRGAQPRSARHRDARPTGPGSREGQGRHGACGHARSGVRRRSAAGVARFELPITHVR
jgi:hypothetical protein